MGIPFRNQQQTKMIYDDSRACSLSPGVAQVKATRNEIWLFFGTSEKTFPNQRDLRADSGVRIILNPLVAKRLCLALDDLIRKHEATYGSLHAEPTTPKVRLLHLPLFESVAAREKAVLLFEALRNLKVRVALERSFKISEKKLLGNRFLVAFKPHFIAENSQEKLSALCVEMGMPERLLQAFQKDFQEATTMGFGIEESDKTCVVKAYLEFKNRYQEALQKASFAPYVSHTGFKWEVTQNSIGALATYRCFPGFTIRTIRERLKRYYRRYDRPPFKTIGEILDIASKKVGDDKFLYIEVSEENNPRSSFDINIYGADMSLQDLFPFLTEIFRHFSVPDKQFMGIYEPVKGQSLGHLSGGRDRTGQDFFTVYFAEA